MPDSSRAIMRPLDAAVSGCVTVPGSKSLTNRAIVLALAAQGTSVLRRPLRSDDTRHGATVARALGATVVDEDDTISITGLGASRPVDRQDLHFDSAGTTADHSLSDISPTAPVATIYLGRLGPRKTQSLK